MAGPGWPSHDAPNRPIVRPLPAVSVLEAFLAHHSSPPPPWNRLPVATSAGRRRNGRHLEAGRRSSELLQLHPAVSIKSRMMMPDVPRTSKQRTRYTRTHGTPVRVVRQLARCAVTALCQSVLVALARPRLASKDKQWPPCAELHNAMEAARAQRQHQPRRCTLIPGL